MLVTPHDPVAILPAAFHIREADGTLGAVPVDEHTVSSLAHMGAKHLVDVWCGLLSGSVRRTSTSDVEVDFGYLEWDDTDGDDVTAQLVTAGFVDVLRDIVAAHTPDPASA